MRGPRRDGFVVLVVLAGVLFAIGVAGAAGAEGIALAPRPGLALLQAEPPTAATTPVQSGQQVSIYKAALLSALLPGLGEAYSGHTYRAVVQGSAEAAIWISYATFRVQEDLRSDRAREFAVAYASALPDGDEDYYKAVGRFLRAEGPNMWNEFVRRRERDSGEIVGREYTGDEAWAWTSDERFDRYGELRRDMLTANDRAKNTLAFAILNRVVSVVSVVQAVRSDHARVHELGLRLDAGEAPFQVARLGLWNKF